MFGTCRTSHAVVLASALLAVATGCVSSASKTTTAGPLTAFAAVSLHRRRPEGSARNAWRGRIDTVEPVGDRLRVRVDGLPPIVAEVTPGAATDVGLTKSNDVWVAVKATEVDVYAE